MYCWCCCCRESLARCNKASSAHGLQHWMAVDTTAHDCCVPVQRSRRVDRAYLSRHAPFSPVAPLLLCTCTGFMHARRIGKSIAASLAKAPRPALGSTVERDDFVNPATMTNTTVLPGDDTKVLTAAVSHT